VTQVWPSRASGSPNTVEAQLNHVIVGLVVIADAKRAWQQEREREETARREVERRRALAEQARREEEERRRVLERQADSWAKSQRLRAFLDEVKRRRIRKGCRSQRTASSAPGSRGRASTPTALIH